MRKSRSQVQGGDPADESGSARPSGDLLAQWPQLIFPGATERMSSKKVSSALIDFRSPLGFTARRHGRGQLVQTKLESPIGRTAVGGRLARSAHAGIA